MKKLIRTTTYVLAITLLLSILPTDAEANIYEDTIRLHILANSDSEEDQALKISVRDGLLLKYGDALRLAGSFAGLQSLPQSGHLPSTSWLSVQKDSQGVQYIPS